jgi:hypothetical protein
MGFVTGSASFPDTSAELDCVKTAAGLPPPVCNNSGVGDVNLVAGNFPFLTNVSLTDPALCQYWTGDLVPSTCEAPGSFGKFRFCPCITDRRRALRGVSETRTPSRTASPSGTPSGTPTPRPSCDPAKEYYSVEAARCSAYPPARKARLAIPP